MTCSEGGINIACLSAGKPPDAFAALTFPISTSEITIAFERAAHFEKTEFHSSRRSGCMPRGCAREGGSVLMKGETDSVI